MSTNLDGKEGEGPRPKTVGGAARLGAGDRVRVSANLRKCDGDKGPGIDLSMFGLIGKAITLQPSPDARWLYAAGYFWLPEWLETTDGTPLAPPEAGGLPEPEAKGSKDVLDSIRDLALAMFKDPLNHELVESNSSGIIARVDSLIAHSRRPQ